MSPMSDKKPLSAAQLAARRANALRSTGPQYSSRYRYNDMTQGIRAETLILPGESHERFDSLLTALLQRHDPQDDATHNEVLLAAKAAWMIERGEGVETARATQAIYDACDGNDDQQADDL